MRAATTRTMVPEMSGRIARRVLHEQLHDLTWQIEEERNQT